MFDLIISIIVLAAVALAVGAFVLWRRGVTKQAMLMAILAFVMIANAAIWLIPMEGGGTPMEAAASAVAEDEAGD
ncbi:hypothetical protein [Aurantiacibacter poecillastricola]|uniref:hypothetical protein n=1 Tax=Aurantiacibacter poecillastricola TaxID=3064385 RepID=UPI00273DCC4A|nr:hypothetical protein [Aurantiacibacter sp. 219JJ12-13]MDP5262551.1 hypothetical protein [Aurantiacibacter sp. 219JJ12-13]